MRTIKQRTIKKNLFIYTTGEKTEVEYFECYKNHVKYSGNYVISKIAPNTCDPINLVKFATKDIGKLKNFSKKDGDEIWIVFDIDRFAEDNTNFKQEIESLAKDKVNLAWSNECFELWFLLHLQEITTEVPRKNYHQKLTKLLKDKCNFEYQKNENIPKLFNLLWEYQSDAIKNTVKLNNKSMTNNPSTNIVALIKKINS